MINRICIRTDWNKESVHFIGQTVGGAEWTVGRITSSKTHPMVQYEPDVFNNVTLYELDGPRKIVINDPTVLWTEETESD